MRRSIVTLHASLLTWLLALGCAAVTGPSPGGGAARPGTAAAGDVPGPPPAPPRPRAPSGPETVDAALLPALRLVRAAALRQEPAARAERFGALDAGDVVLRLDTRGSWYRVWVPGVALSGWIERRAAARPRGAPAALGPVPVAELPVVVVGRNGSRLRSAPSTKGGILRTLAKGDVLRLLDQAGRWVKVYDPEAKAHGYVASRLVRRPR